MSVRMMEAVKRLPVSPTQKLVLLCLADCHNDSTDRCDPSYAYQMEITGLSNRAIADALKALKDTGILHFGDKNGARSNYKFTLETCERGSLLISKPVSQTHSFQQSTCEPDSHPPVNLAPKPVNLAPKPVNLAHTNRKEQEGTRNKREALKLPIPADSQEQVEDFAKSIGLPIADGTWFWFKNEESGWTKSAGKIPIRNWKATMQTWKAGGFFPSQKQTGFSGASLPQHKDPIRPAKPVAPCQDWREKLMRVTGADYTLFDWEDVSISDRKLFPHE